MSFDLSVFQAINHRGKITVVILVYALFSGFWILSSDRLLELLVADPQQMIQINMIKGMAYVAITSLLLYLLLTRWLEGGDRAHDTAPAVSKLRKFILWILALAMVALTLVGMAVNVKHHRDDVVTHMQVLAAHKSQLLADWLRERISDAENLQSSQFVSDSYRLWRHKGDARGGEQLQHRLRQLCNCPGPDGVSLIDEQGVRIFNTEAAPALMADDTAGVAEIAAKDGKIHYTGPHRDGSERLMLDFAVPVAVGEAVSSRRLPVILLHVELTHWLFPRLQMWPTGFSSGESLLLRHGSDQVLSFGGPGLGRNAAVVEDTWSVARQWLDGRALGVEDRIFEGNDYRNVPVVAVAKQVEGSDWYLLDKIDREEIHAKARHELVWIGLVGLLALFVLIGGNHLLQQMQQMMIAQATQSAQSERISALNLLEAIVESSEDAIFAKDMQGRYILFNRAAERFVGKTTDEVLGLDDTVLFPREQALELMALGQRVIAENRALTEEEYLDTSGGKRVFLSTKGPLHDEHGNVTGIFGISRDITERKQAELALSESESRFRALVEQSLAGIYIIQDGYFRYVNPGFAAIFGYPDPEAIVDKVGVAELVCADDRERVLNNIRRRIEREVTDVRYAFNGLRRDGSVVPVEVQGRGFVYLNQPAVIGIVLDASEQVAAKQALQRQAQELVMRNRELESFNRAMVGRELDMIALKRHVNELSRQLGIDPPYNLAFLEGESWLEKD